jgi:hypothetical protein
MSSIRLPVAHEDLKNMSYTDLNNQKGFLSEKYANDEFKNEIDKQNLENINKELQSRNTTYILLVGTGIIVGLFALRKFKN